MTGGAASRPDVLVVGAGVMGAWTALAARRAGLSVTLVDAWAPGHSRGTSSDESRISRAAHGPDLGYLRSSRAALEAWKALEIERGVRLFIEAGALWLAHREDGFEAASLAALRAEGVPVERVAPDEIEARWPGVSAEDVSFGVFEPEAGVLLARRAALATVDAFLEAGGTFELAAVRPGRAVDGRMTDVVTGDGRQLSAGNYVFACGPWLPGLFPDVLGNVIGVTRQEVVYLGPPAGDDRFSTDRMPAWVDYDAAFYGIPAVDGRGFKVGPDSYGPPFDPTDGDRRSDPATVAHVRAYVARRFPGLAGCRSSRPGSASTRRRPIPISSSIDIPGWTTCGSSVVARGTASSTARRSGGMSLRSCSVGEAAADGP